MNQIERQVEPYAIGLDLVNQANRLDVLGQFEEETYLHQVIARRKDGALRRYRDLDDALGPHSALHNPQWEECRVHFHIPLHASPVPPLCDTRDHLLGAADFVAANPGLCRHLEMETYTWEVLPDSLRAQCIEEQLTAEYRWMLDELTQRGLGLKRPRG